MKIRTSNLAYIVISFITIITMTTVYHVNNSTISSMLATIVLVAIVGYPIIAKTKIKIKRIYVTGMLGYIILIGSYCLLKNNGYISCINMLFCCVPGYLFYWLYLEDKGTKEEFIKIFVVMATILAVISIFCWVFVTELKILKPTNYIELQWGNTKYIMSFYNIYFEPQYGRNSAIFAEGPAANYFFFSTLLLNEFFGNYRKKIINTILVIAIITTMTTTGQIGLILYLVYKLISIKDRNKLLVLLRCFVFIAGAIIGLMIVNQLLVDKLETTSGVVRMQKILSELEAFTQKPLMGSGFCSYTEGSSNSITALLADGGIVLWGVYYGPIVGLLIYDIIVYRKINYFVLIYVAIFSVSVFHYTMLATMITALLWYELLARMRTVNNKRTIDIFCEEK